MRVLSGIQPSGNLHLGNYFGAIQQYLELQNEHDCYFFVANYHAMTTVTDAAQLRRLTAECVRDYLALGLDPQKAAIFLQSDVPEVTELAWILSTVTPMGLLQRCHAYKDKVARGIAAHHGLFAYPVLMAADILIYEADIVPVGEDQKQRVEVARDIAGCFNSRYGEILKLPEGRPWGLLPGTDGQKMSKTYGNTIGIFDGEDEIRAKVMGITTDSRPVDEPKDPETCNVFALFRLFADETERRDVERRYRAGGIGYRDMKERVTQLIVAHFAEAKAKRRELGQGGDYVVRVLQRGRRKAVHVARRTLDRVREAVGLRNAGFPQCFHLEDTIGHA